MDDDTTNLRMLQRYFQLLQQHIMGGGEDEEEDDDGTNGLVDVSELNVDLNALLSHPLAHELASRTGCHQTQPDKSLFSMLQDRERGGGRGFRSRQRVHASQRLLPGVLPAAVPDDKPPRSFTIKVSESDSKQIDQYENQVFCGRFSKDGSRFMSACQDRHIRIYDSDLWTLKGDIIARDVGWSIIDTDFSPDQRFLIYSSWSDYIHLCGISEECEETHESLDLKPESHRFCLFSIQFSHTSNEILAGSSDRCLYIYDLDRKERTLRLRAHRDDINSVAWADESSQLLFSGGDDAVVKVWDRRQLGKEGKPVGVLMGHLEGITHVCSRGDGRYLISNSKDQSIKLWDIRAMSDPSAADQGPRITSGWDYRRAAFAGTAVDRKQARVFSGELVHPKDTSLKTYRGHRVFQTLIRAYFSPEATTGQKYIYCGSYDGTVHIYDILTGETVAELDGHAATVRDVSWHPHYPTIVSTSWDGSVRLWNGCVRSLGRRGPNGWQGDYMEDDDEEEASI